MPLPITVADAFHPDVLAAFRERTRLADWGCLVWLGPARGAYGSVRVGGRPVPAHRVAWVQAHYKPVPDGFAVDHLCCNKRCVNPHHLEAVTPAENTRRIHRPPKGWEEVPQPVCEVLEHNGRRWLSVNWLEVDLFGKRKREYRLFTDPEEGAAFVDYLRTYKADRPIHENAPPDIRTRLLKVFTEQGADRWLWEPHRKLNGKSPLELIQVGRSAEVRAITDWMDGVHGINS